MSFDGVEHLKGVGDLMFASALEVPLVEVARGPWLPPATGNVP